MPYRERITVLDIKILTVDSGSGAGVTTFGRSLLSGGSLLSGFTSSHKKIDVNFGGLLLSGGRYNRNFTVLWFSFIQVIC